MVFELSSIPSFDLVVASGQRRGPVPGPCKNALTPEFMRTVRRDEILCVFFEMTLGPGIGPQHAQRRNVNPKTIFSRKFIQSNDKLHF